MTSQLIFLEPNFTHVVLFIHSFFFSRCKDPFLGTKETKMDMKLTVSQHLKGTEMNIKRDRTVIVGRNWVLWKRYRACDCLGKCSKGDTEKDDQVWERYSRTKEGKPKAWVQGKAWEIQGTVISLVWLDHQRVRNGEKRNSHYSVIQWFIW